MAYIVKVTIENTHPPVWRRILLPDRISFADLHEILQTAFGWENCHLHNFTFPVRGIEVLPEEAEAYGDSADEDKTVIDEFLASCKWIRYTYDFGDNWCHKIVLEKTDTEYKGRCAVVLKAKGDNFVEDSGGLWSGEDSRFPFSMDEVNANLGKWEITRKKNSKQGRELLEMLRFEENLIVNKKEIRQNIKKIMQEYLESVEMRSRGEDGQETLRARFSHLSGNESRSERTRMIEDLLEYIQIKMAKNGYEKFCLVLNFNEPVRTMQEMLSDMSEEELEDYCGYVQPGCEQKEPGQCIKTIWETYAEHPEYLLYIFKKEEFILLKKLLLIPGRRSYEIKDVDVLLKSLTVGILDIEISKYPKTENVRARFATDASVLIEKLTEDKIEKTYKENEQILERLEALLATYSVIEKEAFKEQYTRIFRQKLEDKEWQRFIYLSMCFANETQLICTDGTEYLAVPEINVEEILLAREKYEITVPYKQFRKKQLLSDSKGVAEVYPVWKSFEDYLQESYGLDSEEMEYWSYRIYELIQNGASVTEIWMDMEENFEFSFIAPRKEFWEILTDICLNIPTAFLKGYSRLEYFRLTGKEPWKLGLYDWDFPLEDLEENGLLRLAPEQQYELYCVVTKEKNNLEDVRTVKKMIKNASAETSELKFILALIYLKTNEMNKGKQLLEKLYRETEDVSVMQALTVMEQAKKLADAEYGWDNYFEPEEVMGEIIPFRREKEKIGRNAPCPCGSGKKFKQCCLGKGIYD